jgi:hypothetical protein
MSNRTAENLALMERLEVEALMRFDADANWMIQNPSTVARERMEQSQQSWLARVRATAAFKQSVGDEQLLRDMAFDTTSPIGEYWLQTGADGIRQAREP